MMKTNKETLESKIKYKPSQEKKGIYVHIPFCVSKCIYCDFASYPGCSEEQQDRYFTALLREAELLRNGMQSGCSGANDGSSGDGRRRQNDCSDGTSGSHAADTAADSVFIGGGTPSCVPPERIAVLLSRLPYTPDAEITMECNPADLTPRRLKSYREAGVNRLSIGVQSFQDAELCFLGRRHTAAEAEKAFRLAREAGFDNLNLDLIFGFPGQTGEAWERTLQKAMELHPEHLSFYSLQIEEGTPLYRMFRNEQVTQLSDEENRRMYHRASEILRQHGYHHYEISNAALPGRACRHNLKYWKMAPYIGLGAAAHSFDGRKRFYNPSDLQGYEAAVGEKCHAGRLDIDAEEEEDEIRERITDAVFTGLRLLDGLSLTAFSDMFGIEFSQLFEAAIKRLSAQGLLQEKNGCIALTHRGLDLSNYVIGELMEEI